MTQSLSSRQHPLIKHWSALRTQKRYRYSHQSLLIAGHKLVHEVAENHKLLHLIVCDSTIQIPAKEKTIVTPALMKHITGLETPEGIAAEVRMPAEKTLQGKQRVIALDGVNDPGNLGTLIRTACALGWQGAWLLENCCDPYNEKALRAAKGATFHLPIIQSDWNSLSDAIAINQWTPLAASLSGTPLKDFSVPKHPLLIFGNEAQGIRDEIESTTEKITIELSPNTESLNVAVAGGILMYALRGSYG